MLSANCTIISINLYMSKFPQKHYYYGHLLRQIQNCFTFSKFISTYFAYTFIFTVFNFNIPRVTDINAYTICMYVCISKNCYTIFCFSSNIFYIKIYFQLTSKVKAIISELFLEKKVYFQRQHFLKITRKRVQYTIYCVCTYACM